jgi:hypothetical protein
MKGFRIVAHQSYAKELNKKEEPPDTVAVGPDIEDAPFDLDLQIRRFEAQGLVLRKRNRRSAYLSDGETFLWLFIRPE